MSGSGSVWAVIVGSSQYWHNYRHVSNALTMYDAVRSLGVPDSQIVLMLAGDTPCDARNAAPGRVVNARLDGPNLYRPDIEVDYRGAEVTAEAFLRVLTDTLPAGTPGRRLGSGAGAACWSTWRGTAATSSSSSRTCTSSPARSSPAWPRWRARDGARRCCCSWTLVR